MSRLINADIFREYDIRGIADRDLSDPAVDALAQAFAASLRPRNARTVAVGHDMRLSSPRIRAAFLRGLAESGLDVTDLGLCPTPALYFSLFHLKPDAAVMITASHNPPEFNGFKLCVGMDTIYGKDIQNIGRLTQEIALQRQGASGSAGRDPDRGTGTVVSRPIMRDYIAYLTKAFTRHRDVPLKVVLDAGNATAGLAAPEVIRAMGCEVIELFSEPDGTFPNHHPDPTVPENLTTLIRTVRENGADVGIAFDGDSDRLGVVDEQGRMIWGDQLMIIFARDILRDRPGATFLSEVKCSQVMYDDIRARGGKAVMGKTGHSLIKAKMKETGAVMAAEMSGHLFFADRYFGYDDAIYAACRLVELLQKRRATGSRTTVSSLLADLPTVYNTPEIRVDCPDAIKFAVVKKMLDLFAKGLQGPLKTREVITIDGVRVIFDDGWGLIRASNTQPVLVMRFEAKDPSTLETIKTTIENKVRAIIDALAKNRHTRESGYPEPT